MTADAAGLLLSLQSLVVATAALLIERLAGYPDALTARIRHPVVWMGSLIGALDGTLNKPSATAQARRALGAVALFLLLVAVLAVTLPLALVLRALPGGWLLEALLASSLLAQHSLDRSVGDVADGLAESLEAGRGALRHIVGRDPETLDESGVARGALESLAENASDGVVAPLFWLALAGLPGAALYKAINTADSMIGYRNETYRDFGWAAARLDDLVNLPASRLTALLLCAAAAFQDREAGARAWSVMRRDAPKHVSLNAGWPEAAMAGALDVRLGGPRSYGGETVELAWMGAGQADSRPEDIRAGLRLYGSALNLLAALIVALCLIGWLA